MLGSGFLRLLQPLLEDGFQLLGVLEAQLKVLKPADGGLAEVRPVHFGQRLAHVRLRVAELDASLLEAGRELFEIFHLEGVGIGLLGLWDGAGLVRALDDRLVRHRRSDGRDEGGRDDRVLE